MTGERADLQVAVDPRNPFELGDPVDVDQRQRRGQAQLHQRQQALTAGQDPRLVTAIDLEP
ncbi:MAG: hypothetical protein H0U21_05020 [Acidimicrobiia bacterium]|nr:hypothetical protein [Acidimicrobiia bacterium]